MPTPSQKGAIAETAIAAAATKLGISVYRPVAEGGRADLVFEVGRRLLRIQCKWAVRRGDVVSVHLTTSRRTRDGFLRTTYRADEIDAVVGYCAELDECYFLPIALVEGHRALQLRLTPPRNNQQALINWAGEYQLGAIAQLEERRHGMAEVVGSSPTSSTSPAAADEPTLVTAHEFRNRFGWYMQRAAGGEAIVVTHRGQRRLRLCPIGGQTRLVA